MKKRILCFVLTMAMVLSMLVVVPAVTVSADTFDASASEPTITTNADMAAFAAAVTGGNTFAGKTVKLAGDVTLSTTVGGVTTVYPFSGNFNGQGHTVTINQSFSGTQKDGGGLFSLIRVPSGTTLTIQNVHVAGTISIAPSSDYSANTKGGLVSMVETAGSGATLNITNCWSSVRIEQTNSCGAGNLGGFIGYVSHNNSYLNPLTITFESCLWDGTLYNNNQPDAIGGFIGFSGQNKAGRPVTINFRNTVAAGTIDLRQGYGSRVATFIGQLDGSFSGSASVTTVNATNVLSYGSFISSNGTSNFGGGDARNYGNFIRTNDNAYTVLNLTNFYWYEWTLGNKTAKLVNFTSNVSETNVVKYTNNTTSFYALTGSNFSDASKWVFNSGAYPTPKGIYDTFATYKYNVASEFEVGTAAELQEIAAVVASGNSLAGKTIKLTADIDMTGESFTGIGSSSAPFSGNFNGQGHTVTLAQSISTGDTGGLFSYVTVPGSATVTIQNVKVAGTITVTAKTSNHGALISVAKGNSSILNVTNCWSNVTLDYTSGSSTPEGFGGIIGILNSTITVNIDSCLWDGIINLSGATVNNVAGFVGDMNYNSTSRTLNIKNSVAAGKISYNSGSNWGSMFTNLYTADGASGTSTLNLQNVLTIGKFTTSVSLAGKNIASGFAKSNNAKGVVSVTNAYYVQQGVSGLDPVPFTNDTTSVTGSGTVKTVVQMIALTGSAFSDSSKWEISGGTNYPCPAGIYSTFGGQPTSLTVDAYDIYDEFTIGTAAELTALATAVAGGKTYADKTVKLTADIDMTGESFTGIGSSSAPFSGNFNGQGHTVTLDQSVSTGDTGGLFSYVTVPASGITIQNVKVAGTIVVTAKTSNHGALISVAKGNSSTLNVTNCWSNVTLSYTSGSSTPEGFGGIIGILNSTITVNIDSCLWDGIINLSGATVNNVAGFVGDMNYNSANKTLNIKNSVAAGKISYNSASDWGAMFANLYTGGSASGTSTLNLQNVLTIGKFTTSVSLSGKKISSGFNKSNNAKGVVSVTNAYYVQRGVSGISTIPFANDSTSVTGSGTAKTVAQMVALTGSAFSDASKWNITNGLHYPCPASILTTYGRPDSLVVDDVYDAFDSFNIGTADALIAIANDVNGGKNYYGKTVNLTGDIDLGSIAWTSIGSRPDSKAFSGTFNGNGYTISNMTVTVNSSNTGALFGLIDGATIQDFTLTGTITATANSQHLATVVNCVKGTSAIQNVRSSVYLTSGGGLKVEDAGGLVGFMENNQAVNLTIDGCVFDGTINTNGITAENGGIIGDTGLNSSGAKTLTITNTAFNGKINLNDTTSYQYNACFIGCLNKGNGGITVTVNDCVSTGKINFNQGKTWSNNNAYGGSGVLAGYVADGASLSVARFYYLGVNIHNVEGELTAIGRQGSTYGVSISGATKKTETEMSALTGSAFSNASKWKFTANTSYATYFPCPVSFPAVAVAKISSRAKASVEQRNTDDAYKGIRFIGEFYDTGACSNPGTQSAGFGLLLISADLYDTGMDSYAKLVAAGALDVKATKYKTVDGVYVMHAVVYGIPNDCKDNALVAVPYIGEYVGDVISASYNTLFN